jgi:hypothetical protein
MPPVERAFTSSNFFLTLDNTSVGFVRSVEGGDATADVVTEKIGPDRIAKKHLAGVRYEPIEMEVGLDLNQAMYQWMTETLQLNSRRKNGTIASLDANLNIAGELTFHEALITEITIPACDASSKEPGHFTVKFQPEMTRSNRKGGGKAKAVPAKKAKNWLTSNFRLKIDGLDCSRVIKIEAFTIKQKIESGEIGVTREYQKEQSSIEFPNLTLYLPYSHAESFFAWHEAFVIKGNNDDGQEKEGTLELLSANLKDVLATITFSNLGIFKVAPEKVEAGSDSIRRVRVEMYCEKMTLDVKT